MQHPAIEMLEEAYHNWSGGEEAWTVLIKRYLFECAHAIWVMLPQEASRRGVEVAEQYMSGLASDDELSKLNMRLKVRLLISTIMFLLPILKDG